MKLSTYLESRGWTKTDLAKRLRVSKVLVGKWDEIPEKYLVVLEADLRAEEEFILGLRVGEVRAIFDKEVT